MGSLQQELKGIRRSSRPRGSVGPKVRWAHQKNLGLPWRSAFHSFFELRPAAATMSAPGSQKASNPRQRSPKLSVRAHACTARSARSAGCNGRPFHSADFVVRVVQHGYVHVDRKTRPSRHRDRRVATAVTACMLYSHFEMSSEIWTQTLFASRSPYKLDDDDGRGSVGPKARWARKKYLFFLGRGSIGPRAHPKNRRSD